MEPEIYNIILLCLSICFLPLLFINCIKCGRLLPAKSTKYAKFVNRLGVISISIFSTVFVLVAQSEISAGVHEQNQSLDRAIESFKRFQNIFILGQNQTIQSTNWQGFEKLAQNVIDIEKSLQEVLDEFVE